VPWPATPTRAAAPKGRRPVLLDATAGFETAAIYERAAVASGTILDGPAIIEQPDTTILVPRGWRCSAAEGGCLRLERG
jgi:N-methylhydantoinase A